VLLQVILIVAVMAAGAAALTRATAVLMGKLGGETIDRLHSSAESIVEDHAVPTAWQERLRGRFEGLRPGCVDAVKTARHRAKAKAACLKQLSRLIRHFRGSSLVADEEAREILLSELGRAYGEWKSADWDRMCSPDGGQAPARASSH
jgi:hypothetical protein